MLFCCIAFPFAILYTYCKHIKASKVVPDLTPDMSEEERTRIYGKADVNQIRKEAYTESQHQKFLERYGILIEDFKMESLGKNGSIAIVGIQFARRFLFAISIV